MPHVSHYFPSLLFLSNTFDFSESVQGLETEDGFVNELSLHSIKSVMEYLKIFERSALPEIRQELRAFVSNM